MTDRHAVTAEVHS